MTKEQLFNHFPFLSDCEEYDTKKVNDFDKSKKDVKTLFTLPDWLKEFDWLPKWKRENKDTEISYIVSKTKKPMFYWFYKNEVIICFYDEEKDLYYEMLYHKWGKKITLQMIVVLEDLDWSGASA